LEALYPPIGEQVRLDGFQLHYIEAGNGPAVVLIHGSSTNLRDFTASIFDPLTRYCRVVAFDRPGHGYSTYPGQFWMNPEEQAVAIQEALRQLGIERSIWIGHSWAGAVVMAGLLEFPHEVKGGVLLSGAAYHWQGGVDWTNHVVDIPLARQLFLYAALMPVGRLLMDKMIDAAFLPNRPPLNYRRRTGVDLVLRPSQFTINGRDVRLLSDFLLQQSERYPTIDQPLLMIHGREDDIVPAWNHADRLIDLLPQAMLSELPVTGHAPHHVHTEEVARQIARFACAG
jgi:pimeloyl-ACP methyl ester carboxylesterase